MVRALLAGTKTQTRRVVMARADKDLGPRCVLQPHELAGEVNGGNYRNAYCAPGDRLWVRETYMPDPPDDGSWAGTAWRGCKGSRLEDIPERFRTPSHCLHRATWPGVKLVGWRPAIHMPRWASRITLEVTAVRVERLQDISEADAIAEGIEPAYGEWRDYRTDQAINYPVCLTPRASYQTLWESINGPGSWESNPWVWVVSFKRVTP